MNDAIPLREPAEGRCASGRASPIPGGDPMRSLDDLTMYAYGLLEPSAEESLEDHLRACGACANLVRRIGAEHDLFTKSLERAIPSRKLRRRLTEEVLARRRP